MLWLAVLGLVIIGVLGYVAWQMQQKVKQLEEKQHQREVEQIELKDKTRQSIRLLAHGMVNDQLTLTEGCIRISALLDSLYIESTDKKPYEAIYQLAEKTHHIPKLDAWKALSKQEQMDYDIERVNLEQKYSLAVKEAATALADNSLAPKA